MSIQNIGNNRWRVITKTGIDSETGKTLYFDSTIKGTHADAKRLEAEHTLFDKGMFSDLPLKDYADTVWLPAIKDDIAGNTYDFYAGSLKRHIYPYEIACMKLREVTTAVVKAWMVKLPDKGKTAARKTLSALLSYAVEDELIPMNPVSMLRKSTKKTKARRKRAYDTYSDEECIHLMRLLEGTCIEAVCLVMLNAGARREEACALDWESFDWEHECAYVDKAYVVRSGKGTCEMKEPKNDESWRDLEFSGYAADRLYELSVGQSGPICKNTDGVRMRPDYVNDLFQALCRLHGMKVLPVNHLRHTFATQHVKNGTDIATLRDLMGHSSVSTILDNYLKPLRDDKRRAQDRMSERLDPRKVIS